VIGDIFDGFHYGATIKTRNSPLVKFFLGPEGFNTTLILLYCVCIMSQYTFQ
jgi:hypothetical protein